MTTAPGTYVTTATRSLGRSATPRSATVFAPQIGILWGPTDPVLITTEADAYAFSLIPGGPTSPEGIAALLVSAGAVQTLAAGRQVYESIPQIVANGADRVYTKRIAGPDASHAALILLDADADPAVTITARQVGPIANEYEVTVAAGTNSGKKITVRDALSDALLVAGDIVLDDLADNTAIAAAFAANPILDALFEVTVGDGLIVANIADAPLTGGSADLAGIAADPVYGLAFPDELGPGVIIDPGLINVSDLEPPAFFSVAALHAIERKRILLGSAWVEVPTLAATEAEAIAGIAAGFPMDTIAGALEEELGYDEANMLLGAIGLFIGGYTVDIDGAPYLFSGAGAAAGLRATTIAAEGPHRAPAGEAGIIEAATSSAISPTVPITEAVATAIHNSRGNAVRDIAGTVRVYGWRSLADPSSDWAMLTARDTINAIAAEADARTEPIAFRPIDGRGQLIAELAGILTAIGEEAKTAGSTFPRYDTAGTELDPGYAVDTGPTVNTTETLAAGEIRGVLAIRPTPTASLVNITVVKVATNGAL